MFYVPTYVSLLRIDETTALVSSPRETKRLEGKAVGLVDEILPHLYEGCTVEALVSQTDATRDAIEQVLGSLQGIGVLKSAEQREHDFLEWASRSPDNSRTAIEATTLGIVSPDLDVGTVLASTFGDCKSVSLESLPDSIDEMDLVVSFAPGVNPSFHHEVLATVTSTDVPWLPVRLAGREIRLGPMTRPDRGGCYHCYYRRMVASHEDAGAIIDDHRQREEADTYPPYPALATGLMDQFATMQALSFVGEYIQPATVGSMLSIDVLKAESERADLLQLPDCEVCGNG